nr:MAG: hypothetical protein H2Bulk342010_000002 [Totiviridae sp.]
MNQSNVHYVDGHRRQVQKAMELATSANPSIADRVRITGYGNPEPQPIFKVEIPNPGAILRRSKFESIDWSTLHQYKMRRTREMDAAILESGLSGALPGTELRRSTTTYVNSAQRWINGLQVVSQDVQVVRPTPIILRSAATTMLSSLGFVLQESSAGPLPVGISLDPLGYPRAIRIIHTYGSFERLITPLGFSLGGVLRAALAQVPNLGYESAEYGRLLGLVRLGLGGPGQRGLHPVLSKRKERNVLSFMEVFLARHATATQGVQQAVADYVMGNWDLLPPLNKYGLGGDVLSFCRDVVLHSIENDIQYYQTMLALPPPARAVSIYVMEQLIHAYYHKHVATHLGVFIGD